MTSSRSASVCDANLVIITNRNSPEIPKPAVRTICQTDRQTQVKIGRANSRTKKVAAKETGPHFGAKWGIWTVVPPPETLLLEVNTLDLLMASLKSARKSSEELHLHWLHFGVLQFYAVCIMHPMDRRTWRGQSWGVGSHYQLPLPTQPGRTNVCKLWNAIDTIAPPTTPLLVLYVLLFKYLCGKRLVWQSKANLYACFGSIVSSPIVMKPTVYVYVSSGLSDSNNSVEILRHNLIISQSQNWKFQKKHISKLFMAQWVKIPKSLCGSCQSHVLNLLI